MDENSSLTFFSQISKIKHTENFPYVLIPDTMRKYLMNDNSNTKNRKTSYCFSRTRCQVGEHENMTAKTWQEIGQEECDVK
jgi:hypothetical protein